MQGQPVLSPWVAVCTKCMGGLCVLSAWGVVLIAWVAVCIVCMRGCTECMVRHFCMHCVPCVQSSWAAILCSVCTVLSS